jgi:uncharacterized protein
MSKSHTFLLNFLNWAEFANFMNIAIIGASSHREKYGNKAVRAYVANGDTVFPINPKEDKIENLPCYKSVLDVPNRIDVVSLYVQSKVGLALVPEFVKKKIPVAYLNPGAESQELISALESAGIEARVACSILAIGKFPGDFP